MKRKKKILWCWSVFLLIDSKQTWSAVFQNKHHTLFLRIFCLRVTCRLWVCAWPYTLWCTHFASERILLTFLPCGCKVLNTVLTCSPRQPAEFHRLPSTSLAVRLSTPPSFACSVSIASPIPPISSSRDVVTLNVCVWLREGESVCIMTSDVHHASVCVRTPCECVCVLWGRLVAWCCRQCVLKSQSLQQLW